MSSTQHVPNPAAMQSLLQDEAYLLASRGVIRLRGEGAVNALQRLVVSSLADISRQAVYTLLLDQANCLFADLFVVEHQGDLLLECELEAMDALVEKLQPLCDAQSVEVADATDQWRVFAELPDQSTFKDGGEYIRYVDPRWHMGARLLRPVHGHQSYAWGNELKWQAHAFKLGLIPNVYSLRGWGIGAREASLHTLGLLHAQHVDENLQAELADSIDTIKRRVLPFRVEPNASAFPTMTGERVYAGELALGTLIAHEGLYGLALVELDSWRAALQAVQPLRCAGQSVSVTWPTWLARESRGRAGPVAVAGVY